MYHWPASRADSKYVASSLGLGRSASCGPLAWAHGATARAIRANTKVIHTGGIVARIFMASLGSLAHSPRTGGNAVTSGTFCIFATSCSGIKNAGKNAGNWRPRVSRHPGDRRGRHRRLPPSHRFKIVPNHRCRPRSEKGLIIGTPGKWMTWRDNQATQSDRESVHEYTEPLPRPKSRHFCKFKSPFPNNLMLGGICFTIRRYNDHQSAKRSGMRTTLAKRLDKTRPPLKI